MILDSKIILILKKDNVYYIDMTWVYPYPPTTIYHNPGRLRIEIYEYVYTDSRGRSHYKFLLDQEDTSTQYY